METAVYKMTYPFDRPRRWGLAALLLILCLYGCGPRGGEVSEAKALGRTLLSLAPSAKDLIDQEHVIANELKITLDEASTINPEDFRGRFNGYVDRLIAIRNKRRQIQETVRQGVWQSPMVHVVQHDAVVQMQDEITRTETWIEFAQNIRLRSDLGRKAEFPELPKLNKQLDSFLGQPPENPLGAQVRTLMEEYRFAEGEIFE
jgi:hypothetical protein